MANVLPFQKQVFAVSALVEGNSIRSVSRMTGVHRDTIMRLGVRVGEGCVQLHDQLFQNLHVGVLELDELWGFVGKKQRRLKEDDQPGLGDRYCFIALDALKKTIVSYAIGVRDVFTTQTFIRDVRARVVNRPQITTDGFAPYVEAIESAFGYDVDYAMLIKEYQGGQGYKAQHRYSPSRIKSAERKVVMGSPQLGHISTSYVERQNLTCRMHCRRLTRLTNGFSKKPENHDAALALHIAWYNLCRVHETLKVTPAMEIGVTDHVWSVGELIEAALSSGVEPSGAGEVAPVATEGRATQVPWLRVVK